MDGNGGMAMGQAKQAAAPNSSKKKKKKRSMHEQAPKQDGRQLMVHGTPPLPAAAGDPVERCSGTTGSDSSSGASGGPALYQH